MAGLEGGDGIDMTPQRWVMARSHEAQDSVESLHFILPRGTYGTPSTLQSLISTNIPV